MPRFFSYIRAPSPQPSPLAALEIGRSFVKIRGRWWIVLSAAETEEKRADERRINELLIPFIDRYLDLHRPLLVRPGSPPSALWLLEQ